MVVKESQNESPFIKIVGADAIFENEVVYKAIQAGVGHSEIYKFIINNAAEPQDAEDTISTAM